MPATYLNPLTDFGFKKLFGEEPNKDLLISFLNTLLPEHHQIADLQYTKNEYQGITSVDRRVVFDLSCRSASGERFIIELQKVKQDYFKDRSIYYSTFAVQEQAKQGAWDYKLSTVYTVGILDFLIEPTEREVIYYAHLKDQNNRTFFDKLNYIYVVLPRFTKTLGELETLQDKWLYTFRHLSDLTNVPERFHERIFSRLFAVAELAQFTPQDRQQYEDSLKYLRDLYNHEQTFRREGKREGLAEGLQKGREEGELRAKETTARRMLSKGMDAAMVAELVGLPEETVRAWAEA